MTTTATWARPAADTDRRRARQALVPVAVACFVVTTFLNVARADSAGESISMVALDLVILALVYPFVVARGLRQETAGGRAITLGALGLLLIVPAFWSGLPLVLGAGAALLGHAGRRATKGSGRAMAGFVLGLLAVIGYLATYISDWIANPGASWWS